MKIRIGQIIRVKGSTGFSEVAPSSALVDWQTLTAGLGGLPADVNKGIFGFKAVREPGAPQERRPAVILQSNPFKAETDDAPWLDIIDPDSGYALFHGDNRTPGDDALNARGNRLLADLFPLYRNPTLRAHAPPVLVFRQGGLGGKKKGTREFCGYGVPVKLNLVVAEGAPKGGSIHQLGCRDGSVRPL